MIKDRIIQLIEQKGIKKEEFFKKIGMTSANFRGKAKKTPLNSNAIENILTEIPDLNGHWLLTGKGEMLKDVTSDSQTVHIDGYRNVGGIASNGATIQYLEHPSNDTEKLNATINSLQDMLKDKERIIEEKERLIGILLDQQRK